MGDQHNSACHYLSARQHYELLRWQRLLPIEHHALVRPLLGPCHKRALHGGLAWELHSKTEWVYGFKVAFVVDPDGVITAFGLALASSDERPIGDALIASDHYGVYLADKGFTEVEWERLWMERYGAPVAATPKNDSRRAWPKADRRWAAGKRQIIKGVIGQLKAFFSLERRRAKTLGGLLVRLAAKVAVYTCGQRINHTLG